MVFVAGACLMLQSAGGMHGAPAFTYLPMRVMPYARHTAALTFFYRFAIIFRLSPKGVQRRAIAQLVSVQVWGTWGPRFKSGLPDLKQGGLCKIPVG